MCVCVSVTVDWIDIISRTAYPINLKFCSLIVKAISNNSTTKMAPTPGFWYAVAFKILKIFCLLCQVWKTVASWSFLSLNLIKSNSLSCTNVELWSIHAYKYFLFTVTKKFVSSDAAVRIFKIPLRFLNFFPAVFRFHTSVRITWAKEICLV